MRTYYMLNINYPSRYTTVFNHTSFFSESFQCRTIPGSHSKGHLDLFPSIIRRSKEHQAGEAQTLLPTFCYDENVAGKGHFDTFQRVTIPGSHSKKLMNISVYLAPCFVHQGMLESHTTREHSMQGHAGRDTACEDFRITHQGMVLDSSVYLEAGVAQQMSLWDQAVWNNAEVVRQGTHRCIAGWNNAGGVSQGTDCDHSRCALKFSSLAKQKRIVKLRIMHGWDVC